MRVDKISTNISHGPFAVADLLVDVEITLLKPELVNGPLFETPPRQIITGPNLASRHQKLITRTF